MGGFWVARCAGKAKYAVQLAMHAEDFGKLHPFDGLWSMNCRRWRSAWEYRDFRRLTGVTLKPGEGPVFVETRRV